MIGWLILCIILVILALALLTPVKARASFQEGELSAQVRYGFIKLSIYPLKKASKQESPKKRKSKEKKPKKQKKPKRTINREQIFYSLEQLPPILMKALKRVGRRITIEPLQVSLLIAGTNPADTASLYGRLTAALANALPVLQRLVRVREQDVRLYLDFAGEQIQVAADVGVSIRPWDALVIGVCAGASLIKWLLGFRRLATPLPTEKAEKDAEQDKTTGEAA